ncbi:alpha-amylase family protein [Actinopolymorpha pittospori]|uniref:ThuA-like domain-containing protein n=1 Tax=Actinopolymorpha pittospori TaxID=648752 RepID=A0A927RLR2_9ACTN|nr:alpha-amylase family protein [Actinopolymorpha pittospori]MBE1608118.1 hypothetical protein [Actinopolymorpha pittospori]
MTYADRQWHDKPLRVVQTVLREIDIEGYDPQAVVDYVKRLHGNVLIVNGGGLWAFYPSDVPGHHRVAGMSGDILRELRDLTAKDGIRLLARVDFRGGHRDMFEAHPDWFSYDGQGQPLFISGLHAATPCSPFRNEGYGFKIVREILQRYAVDGIWENAPSFGPLAYGPDVERRFRQDTGLELPRDESWDDPAYRAWREWRHTCVQRHSEDFRRLIKSFGDDKAYVAEGPSGLDAGWLDRSALDLQRLGPLWDIVAAPTFDLIKGSYGSGLLPAPVWRCEEATKYLRAAAPGKPATILFGPFDNSSRYTSVVTAELRLWLAGALANGGGFWDCTFVGTHGKDFLDQRGQEDIGEFFQLLERKEDVFDEVESVADVAVVHSRLVQERFGSNDPHKDGYIQHVRGVELALLDNHVPYDLVLDTRIDAQTLSRYRVVVLPNAAVLSPEQESTIREYVRSGGGLVATYETSLYDADLQRRDDYGLSDVFGAHNLGVRRGPLVYGYSWIAERTSLTEGLDDTQICTNNGYIWLTSAQPGSVPVTLIPEIVPQPPERGWGPAVTKRGEPTGFEPMRSSLPVVVTQQFGTGRSVFFPGQTDKLAASDGHPDYGLLLHNAIRWAAGDTAPLVATDAPAAVHVTLMRHRDGRLIVHLLNYCGGYRRPITEIQPVTNVTIDLRCPVAPESARLLRGDRELEVKHANGRATFTVPVVNDYEAVVLGPIGPEDE